MVLYDQNKRVQIVQLNEDLPEGSEQVGIKLGNGNVKYVPLHKLQLLEESDAEDSPAPSRVQRPDAEDSPATSRVQHPVSAEPASSFYEGSARTSNDLEALSVKVKRLESQIQESSEPSPEMIQELEEARAATQGISLPSHPQSISQS